MPKSYPTEKLLLKVIDDLSDFLPYLMLVGGWVPYVYAKYVWKNGPSLAVNTTDIDFGIIKIKYSGKQTIASRVQKLGYGEHHVSMDRMVPFVPIAKGKDGFEQAEVEFITDLKGSQDIKKQLVGNEIKINEIQYFELLFESIKKVAIGARTLQIPSEAIFVFHKCLTFALRGNEDKFRKDLYYVYYMLRFSPDGEVLVNEVKALIKKYKEGKIVVDNLKKHFIDKDAKGPLSIEKENGTDIFIHNVRQDAYDRIIQLLP